MGSKAGRDGRGKIHCQTLWPRLLIQFSSAAHLAPFLVPYKLRNGIHPFREENGRTQREFIRELGLHASLEIDRSRVTRDRMTAASRESFQTGIAPAWQHSYLRQ